MYRSNKELNEISFMHVVEGFLIVYVIVIIDTIYKENNSFSSFEVVFLFPKIPSIFNTNDTCNK